MGEVSFAVVIRAFDRMLQSNRNIYHYREYQENTQ